MSRVQSPSPAPFKFLKIKHYGQFSLLRLPVFLYDLPEIYRLPRAGRSRSKTRKESLICLPMLYCLPSAQMAILAHMMLPLPSSGGKR